MGLYTTSLVRSYGTIRFSYTAIGTQYTDFLVSERLRHIFRRPYAAYTIFQNSDPSRILPQAPLWSHEGFPIRFTVLPVCSPTVVFTLHFILMNTAHFIPSKYPYWSGISPSLYLYILLSAVRPSPSAFHYDTERRYWLIK